jgi:hypothetical protein
MGCSAKVARYLPSHQSARATDIAQHFDGASIDALTRRQFLQQGPRCRIAKSATSRAAGALLLQSFRA